MVHPPLISCFVFLRILYLLFRGNSHTSQSRLNSRRGHVELSWHRRQDNREVQMNWEVAQQNASRRIFALFWFCVCACVRSEKSCKPCTHNHTNTHAVRLELVITFSPFARTFFWPCLVGPELLRAIELILSRSSPFCLTSNTILTPSSTLPCHQTL